MTDLVKLGVYAAIAGVIGLLLWGAWHSADTWCNGACKTEKAEVSRLRAVNVARDAKVAEEKAIRDAKQKALEEDAIKTRADLAVAQKQILDAEAARRAAIANLGRVVRDLADARSVLSAGSASASGGAATGSSPAPVRSDATDSGADPAGRLIACQKDLTVLTDTMSVNKTNHELALVARDACVEQYNKVRRTNNQE